MDVDDLDAFIADKLEMCKGEWDWNEEAKDLQFIRFILWWLADPVIIIIVQ